jgi:hypothetical protein
MAETVSEKPKRLRRRNDADPLDEFIAFNFAQATARIIDNIGFSSTKPLVLELLSRLMMRYFEDLCKRIVYSKEDGKFIWNIPINVYSMILAGRFVATIDDVMAAYTDLQISADEFQEYTKQVYSIPSVPQV